MALSSCFSSSQVCVFLRVDRPRLPSNTSCNYIISQGCVPALRSKNTEIFGRQMEGKKVNQFIGWSLLGGSRIICRPNLERNVLCRKSSAIYASWLPYSEIASSAFTLGTAAVLPFYTLMTKKLVESSLPYMVLGSLYAYLLCLSWTPDTIRLMFASKYWLPELSGIAKMFSSDMTLASAWIHLLAVDLFAARQVYEDGLQNDIETRHSVSLCLLFCPIGILAHFVTKALTRSRREKEHGIH